MRSSEISCRLRSPVAHVDRMSDLGRSRPAGWLDDDEYLRIDRQTPMVFLLDSPRRLACSDGLLCHSRRRFRNK